MPAGADRWRATCPRSCSRSAFTRSRSITPRSYRHRVRLSAGPEWSSACPDSTALRNLVLTPASPVTLSMRRWLSALAAGGGSVACRSGRLLGRREHRADRRDRPAHRRRSLVRQRVRRLRGRGGAAGRRRYQLVRCGGEVRRRGRPTLGSGLTSRRCSPVSRAESAPDSRQPADLLAATDGQSAEARRSRVQPGAARPSFGRSRRGRFADANRGAGFHPPRRARHGHSRQPRVDAGRRDRRRGGPSYPVRPIRPWPARRGWPRRSTTPATSWRCRSTCATSWLPPSSNTRDKGASGGHRIRSPAGSQQCR